MAGVVVWNLRKNRRVGERTKKGSRSCFVQTAGLYASVPGVAVQHCVYTCVVWGPNEDKPQSIYPPHPPPLPPSLPTRTACCCRGCAEQGRQRVICFWLGVCHYCRSYVILFGTWKRKQQLLLLLLALDFSSVSLSST